MSDERPYLAIDRVSVGFGGAPVVRGVSLAMRRGEFLVLLGPSGCGKSTMLKALAGLIATSGGSMALDGAPLDPLPAHRRDIGLVFQNYALFPHMTVADNLGFGLQMRGVPKREAAARVAEALAMTRLEDVARRWPAQLSGGQQQRVALARAMVIRPRLLLLDEPLSNLDATLRAQMRFEIRDLHRRAGLTTIMVTHDQSEAMAMADRIAVMRAGAIQQVGAPREIYERPATGFVASFVGLPPAALLPLAVAADGEVRVGTICWRPSPALAARLARHAPGEALLCVRPERAQLTVPNAPGAVQARVVGCEYLGADHLVRVVIGETAAIVRSDAAPAGGAIVGLLVADNAPLFDAAGMRALE